VTPQHHAAQATLESGSLAFHDLAREDSRAVQRLLEQVTAEYGSSEDERLLRDLPVLSARLPPAIRAAVNQFRKQDRQAALVVRGHLVDDERMGPTPEDWRGRGLPGRAFAEEVLVLLYGSLLGDPFGWRTQQDGHLVHEVLPIARDEYAQLGSGSRVLLTWHTEDAFHDFRADYVLLYALRNPDGVPTTVGWVDVGELSDHDVDVLFQPRFIIRPDDSHQAHNNTIGAGEFGQIAEMTARPEPIAVFSGARPSPYLRIDPYFMDVLPGDAEARRALDAVCDVIERSIADVVLEPGDLIILDNAHAVHGRRPFTARFDGTDRWLKRINVTRDLRKSRAARSGPSSLLIG